MNQRVRNRSRVLAAVEFHSWSGCGEATVKMLRTELRLSEGCVRSVVSSLVDDGFLDRVPSTWGRAVYAYRAVRKEP